MKTPEEKREYDRMKKAEERAKDPEGYCAYMRSWCSQNRKKVRDANNQYYQKFRERLAKRARDYRASNSELVREQARKRHEAKKNDPKYVAKRRQYAQTRQAIARGAVGKVEKIDIIGLKIASSICPYCGGGYKSEKDKHLDHIHPLCQGGEHKLYNVLVCCKTCNLKKGRHLPLSFAVKF